MPTLVDIISLRFGSLTTLPTTVSGVSNISYSPFLYRTATGAGSSEPGITDTGYGAVIGRIAGPSLVLQAIAPLVLALVAERVSDPAVLMVLAAMALIAFCGLALVRRPHA